VITILSLLVTVLGAGSRWRCSASGTALEQQPPAGRHRGARNLYTDAFNEAVFEKPAGCTSPGRWSTSTARASTAGERLAPASAAAPAGCAAADRLRRSYALSMLTGACWCRRSRSR
jgi:NADH-quinone oxidoreductase subunit L